MPPTVVFSDNLPGTANRTTGSITYTLNFSEPALGLDASDFTVTNGTVSAVAGSGDSWTVSVTPTLNVSSGVVGLTLVAGAVTDLSGNPNLSASDTSQAIDTRSPWAPQLVTNASFAALVNPQVTYQTSMGTFVVELDPDHAPVTVANLLAYVNLGFYDGTLIHRTVPNFVIQGGGFTSGPVQRATSYVPIVLESNNGLSNLRGTIAMARTTSPDSATDQFFVNVVNDPSLNFASISSPGYAVFGSVISGMSVIDAMAVVPTRTVGSLQNVPVTDITILSARQTVAGSAVSTTGVLAVSDLEAGANWSWSVDAGNSWTAGVGSSFTVPLGHYSAGAVRVREFDAAGNVNVGLAAFTSALVVEPAISIDPGAAVLAEGDAGTTDFSFTVTRSGVATGASSVQWSVTGGSASASDFAGGTLPSGTVSFAAGETSKSVVVHVAGDTTPESDETFTVTLSNPVGALVSRASAVGTIVNDDGLAGTAGNDLLTGTAGNDRIFGLDGWDTLVGGAGDDLLDGGAGLDEARYGAARAQFTTLRLGDGDIRISGPEGTDTLHDVERAVFTDVALAFDVDGTGGEAYRLYKAAFDRLPDDSGLGFWMYYLDRGFDFNTAADAFLNSAEFRAMYGPNPTNNQFVGLLYQHVLQRLPDQGGYDFWNAAMTNEGGAYGHAWSKGEVLVLFSESAENKVNVIGQIENGFEYQPYAP